MRLGLVVMAKALEHLERILRCLALYTLDEFTNGTV